MVAFASYVCSGVGLRGLSCRECLQVAMGDKAEVALGSFAVSHRKHV
jgi:hypothetical protein